MAYALVSMVVNKLREEVYLVGDAKEEVEKLSSTLESIQALLNDAEIMQFHNPSIQVWLKKFKVVVYDVEDVVDEMIPFPKSESGTHDGDDQTMGNQAWACLFSVFSCCGLEDWMRLAHESMSDSDDIDNRSIRGKVRTFVSKVASQRDFALQIKQVGVKLDQIADATRMFNFQLNHGFRGGSELCKAEYQTSSLVDESSSLVDELKILGRDRDKDIIISQLVSGSSGEEGRIRVISIVGVGGLGKTTLARLIYNDKRKKKEIRFQNSLNTRHDSNGGQSSQRHVEQRKASKDFWSFVKHKGTQISQASQSLEVKELWSSMNGFHRMVSNGSESSEAIVDKIKLGEEGLKERYYAEKKGGKKAIGGMVRRDTSGIMRRVGGNFKERFQELGGLDAVFDFAVTEEQLAGLFQS